VHEHPRSGAAVLTAPSRAGASLLSVGAAIPETVVPTAALAERAGVSEDWLVSRTGIHERRHARADERVADYAVSAGRDALAQAGLEAAQLELVLVGTMSPDYVTPNVAPEVAHALGAHAAGALDVGAACTSFLGALGLGAAWIEAGRAANALVIGADFISRYTDFGDRSTAALFSDGAGAVVLAGGEEGRVGPVLLRADGAHAGTILATHEEAVIRMDGPEVFRHAVARMGAVVQEAAAAAGVTLADVDLFVFHQANARITRALTQRLGVDPERVVDTIGTLGNNSAATIPLALEWARREGRLLDGSTVALGAFGAGFTWGGAIVTWGRG
jgi:3-oxoacyl-[acyl-carrier-protein] synthase III